MIQHNIFKIIRKHFNYLMSDFGFSIADEEILKYYDGCKTIYESSKCKIRINYDLRDEVYISAGPIHASNNWQDSTQNLWFNVWLVTKILNDEGKATYAWDPPLRDKTISLERGIDKQLKLAADQLKPICPYILELFNERNFPNTMDKIQIIRNNSIKDMYDLINQNNTKNL